MNAAERWARIGLAAACLAGCGGRALPGTSGSDDAGAPASPSGAGGAAASVSPPGSGGEIGTAGATGGATPADAGASTATLADGTCKAGAFPHLVGGQKTCLCQTDVPTACATACVDLTTDVDNCGACGASCAPHATCNAGVCGAEPTVAVAKPAGPCRGLTLTASADHLYWTDAGAGRVWRLDGIGHAPVAISGAGTTSPTLIDVEGATVFWLDGRVIRAASNGVVSTVTTSPTDVHGLVASADGATVYFSTENVVRRVSSTGGTPVDVAVEDNGRGGPQAIPMALALAGTVVATPTGFDSTMDMFELGPTSARCVNRGPIDQSNDPPGSPENVMCTRHGCEPDVNLSVIVPWGNQLIWAEGQNLTMNPFTADPIADQTTLGATSEVDDNGGDVVGMAVAHDALYLTEHADFAPEEGELMTVGLASASALTPLARNLDAPGSIAVTGGQIFFATADCEIETLPEPK